MPPIHPALVHLPIALVIFSVVADVAGYFKNNESLRAAGAWGLIGASIGAILSVPTGLYDWSLETIKPESLGHLQLHMYVGYAMLVAVIGLTVWRWAIRLKESRSLNWGYFIIALLVLGLTLFQGFIGGTLVMEHGVGVTGTGQGTQPPSRTKEDSHTR